VAARSCDEFVPGHLLVIDMLLAAGAEIECVDNDGYTPLSCTPLHGNVEVARKLLTCGADVGTAGARALRDAVSSEHDTLLDLFIASGSAVDTPYADEVLTPLILAAHEGYVYGIKTLLDHGANIEAVTIDGETPLLNAVRKQNHDCVALLLERGANPNHTDHYENTAVSWAERRQDARMIELLKL
jgi:ankyrin repeat protein